MGLNDSFGNIKAHIILIKPLPTLSEAYALVQEEEKRKQISSSLLSTDSMALATQGNYYSKTHFPKRERPYCSFCKSSGHSLERCFKENPHIEKPICSHCNVVRHTIKKCYKLHGYPPGHKLYGKNKSATPHANQIYLSTQDLLNDTSQISIPKENLQHLLALL